ncbi:MULTISPECIES: hypothetical protein [unclassified Caballeronia]|uniref:hypothetical protein n=1 Tax=unclassified Caballeronia TaxID=2646786 RepID=UPI000A06EE14|nr:MULTISPECIES: hypothetical protein [unclassified Caballeronia]MCE4546399.1 hypothetical protein [Caballeronia sp. PC1]MCE4573126.1 hypothetical protein [Caballeronia sp. CLC5]
MLYETANVDEQQHPKKEIEEALDYVTENGWRVEPAKGNGHAWGRIYCPFNDKECRCGEFCITSVWCTPRSAGNHANLLKRVVDNCTSHRKNDASSGDDSEKLE